MTFVYSQVEGDEVEGSPNTKRMVWTASIKLQLCYEFDWLERIILE